MKLLQKLLIKPPKTETSELSSDEGDSSTDENEDDIEFEEDSNDKTIERQTIHVELENMDIPKLKLDNVGCICHMAI